MFSILRTYVQCLTTVYVAHVLASSDGIIGEWWIWEAVKRSGLGLIWITPTFAWRERWNKPRWTSLRTVCARMRFWPGTSRLQLEQISWSCVQLTTALTRRVCVCVVTVQLVKWLVSGLLKAVKTRVMEIRPREALNSSLLNVNWPRRVKTMALMERLPARSFAFRHARRDPEPRQRGWKAENNRSTCNQYRLHTWDWQEALCLRRNV
jgi:hypothetical protein